MADGGMSGGNFGTSAGLMALMATLVIGLLKLVEKLAVKRRPANGNATTIAQVKRQDLNEIAVKLDKIGDDTAGAYRILGKEDQRAVPLTYCRAGDTKDVLDEILQEMRELNANLNGRGGR